MGFALRVEVQYIGLFLLTDKGVFKRMKGCLKLVFLLHIFVQMKTCKFCMHV